MPKRTQLEEKCYSVEAGHNVACNPQVYSTPEDTARRKVL